MDVEFGGRKFSFLSRPEQWEKLKALCAAYFLHPAVLFSFLLLIGCFAVWGFTRCGKSMKIAERIRSSLPFVYMLLIFSLALFNRTPGVRGSFHVRFDYVLEGTAGFHETRLLMAAFDFLYYIPYGFLMRWGRSSWKWYTALLWVTFTGLAVEILQWGLALGVGTVEHWMLYTLGGITGIGICEGMTRRFAGRAVSKHSGECVLRM